MGFAAILRRSVQRRPVATAMAAAAASVSAYGMVGMYNGRYSTQEQEKSSSNLASCSTQTAESGGFWDKFNEPSYMPWFDTTLYLFYPAAAARASHTSGINVGSSRSFDSGTEALKGTTGFGERFKGFDDGGECYIQHRGRIRPSPVVSLLLCGVAAAIRNIFYPPLQFLKWVTKPLLAQLERILAPVLGARLDPILAFLEHDFLVLTLFAALSVILVLPIEMFDMVLMGLFAVLTLRYLMIVVPILIKTLKGSPCLTAMINTEEVKVVLLEGVDNSEPRTYKW